MHAEYFFINESCHREAVETICKYFPQSDIKPPFTLIKKPIYSVYRCTLMVAPQKEKILRILNFICKEKAYCF
jgi:hypothetical protein